MRTATDEVMQLQVVDARKRYGDTVALSGLSMTARSGEITGIAGPNGAGKSTLVKALAGEISLDAGTITYGAASSTADAKESRAARTAVVHQETSLFPNLTVAENLALSRPPVGFGVPKSTAQDRSTMAALGILQHANRRVVDCSLVVRQLTEIARAFVLDDADVLLLDEPNSALTVEESALLFERVLDIKRDNRIVLLVSHRLEDLVAYCDRVLIVRDGRVTSELSGPDLSESGIARELVVDSGHSGYNRVEEPRPVTTAGTSRLEVRDWAHKRLKFRAATFDCNAGEVTAIVGNEGSGARELLRSLGRFEPAAGECVLREGAVRRADFSSQYMPAERQVSLFTNLDCGKNVVTRLGVPDISTRAGWLRSQRMKKIGQDLLTRFVVRGGGSSTNIRALSGGNQQKVAIAAAVASEPSVLLLEEPTRGVDISSKAEIYRLLTDYAAGDRVVVTFCSEIPEVFELADQVLAVAEGEVIGSRRVSDFATVADLAHALAEMAAGHKADRGDHE